MSEPIEANSEVQPEQKAPVVDPSRPLSQQVDRMINSLPENKKDDDKGDDKSTDKDEKDAKESDNKPDTDKPADKEDGSAKDDVSKDADTDDEEDQEELQPKLEELPPEAKYILDRLPDIQAYGHTGDGKDKIIRVKRLEDLPLDFEFAGGRRAEMAFMAANNAQELNARDLQAKYRQEQQQQQYAKLKQQENVDVASDIKSLQREGLLPKFQYPENDSRFNDDPAVKEANEIYAIYEKTNAEYMKAGRTYRVSYRDAADKYYAMQYRNKPKEDKAEKKDSRTAEDVAREKAVHKTSGRTGEPSEAPRRMPPGSTTRDVLRLYEQGRI